MQKPKIVVVIPCYKVKKTIINVIKKIPPLVDLIVVVDDKSPDNTYSVVKDLKDPRVILALHKVNRGVGGAMKTGYAIALQKGAEFIVKVDGDDQMDIAFLEKLIEPVISRQADYSKGNRFLHPKELTRMPLIRRIGNLGLTFLTKAASGYWNLFDPTNGYTAISARILRELDPKNISDNYFFETSMLCELRKNNAVVKDVAIPAIYKGEGSSLSITRQLVIFPVNLIRRTIDRLIIRYFLYDFSAASFYIFAGLVLLIFGLIWGIIKWTASIKTGIPSTTGTVLIAVLPVILGVQFLVQAAAMDIQDVPDTTNIRSSQSKDSTQISEFEKLDENVEMF